MLAVGRSPNADNIFIRRAFNRSSSKSADFISSIAHGASTSHSFDSVVHFPHFYRLAIMIYAAQTPKSNSHARYRSANHWLGMQRMYDLALAWNTFGPGVVEDREKEKTYV
jgi:hypothetical protein